MEQMIKQAMLVGFFDEFEKLAKTVLMKKLSPAAKRLMDRMTGATHGASIPQNPSARRLRHALTGKKAPELMTEMHGMRGMLSPAEQAAKKRSAQHFEGVLRSQGKVYKGAPGTEQAIKNIGGHGSKLTRTGAQVGEAGTAAATPMAKVRQSRAQRMGTAPTLLRPQAISSRPMATAPTQLAPRPGLQRAA
jgi:hypothetical protein